ncbi:MAG TPA: FAD-linked oxidase C-terminal domain-containing protein [Bacteroidota bacterium]|nr:FAD-linked oxidase C-terminal domain-containing protein [Bacteroidota bacterium]
MIALPVLKKVREIVGSDNFLDSPESLIAYSYDATAIKPQLPVAIVRPSTAEQISQILILANEERFPIVPRGSGTGLSGGALPVEDSIVILTNHWNRILEIDRENMTVWVQPGVITAHLHQAVERIGFMYPPDPGSSSICTLGGNVAENSGGLRGLKYGVTKNYVLGLEVVLPTGEILHTGGKSVKDVAGYNLKDVLIGSEGTLGIFTKILLRIIPQPQTGKTLIVFYSSVEDAARAVSAIIAAKITPAMLEFLDQVTIRCVEDYTHLGLPTDAEAMLLIEVDGRRSVVDEDAAIIIEICRRHNATGITTARDLQDSVRLKSARRAAFASLARVKPTTIMEDVAVPRADLAQLVARIREIGRKNDVMIGNFGHAGDGNLHPNYMTDERDREAFARAEKTVFEVEEAAIDLGGTITGEHGVGLYKKRLLEKMVGSPSMQMMRTLKQMMDPNNVLNPGKILDLKPRCEGPLPRDRDQIKKFDDVAWI